METKVCLNCSKIFERGKKGWIVWSNAKYCSRTCSNVHLWKTWKHKAPVIQYHDTTKNCLECWMEMVRWTIELAIWNKRKFCSKWCGSKYSWKVWKNRPLHPKPAHLPDSKICPICNLEFTRWKWRSWKSWETQECCWKVCAEWLKRTQQKPYKKTRRLKLLMTGTKFQNKRIIVLARDNFACQICWFREPLIMEVDHKIPRKDDISLENNFDNLWTLCPLCHKRKTLKESKKIDSLLDKVALLQEHPEFLSEIIRTNKMERKWYTYKATTP